MKAFNLFLRDASNAFAGGALVALILDGSTKALALLVISAVLIWIRFNIFEE